MSFNDYTSSRNRFAQMSNSGALTPSVNTTYFHDRHVEIQQYAVPANGPPVLLNQDGWSEHNEGSERTPLPSQMSSGFEGSSNSRFGASYDGGKVATMPYSKPYSPEMGSRYVSTGYESPRPQSPPSTFGVGSMRSGSGYSNTNTPGRFDTFGMSSTDTTRQDLVSTRPQPGDFAPSSSYSDTGAMTKYEASDCRLWLPDSTKTTFGPGWMISNTMSRADMTLCIKRFCEEINWDWYSDNISKMNMICGSGTSMDEVWGQLSELYEEYCACRALGQDPFNSIARGNLGRNVNVTESLRIIVHNMFTVFGPFGPKSPNDARECVEMAQTLLSGGDITKYVRQKCQVHGLSYPGGTGRTADRIGIFARLSY